MKKAKPNMKRKLIISGHSNGLGRALAEYYLRWGDEVLGLSRRRVAVESSEKFQQHIIDLSDSAAVAALWNVASWPKVGKLIGGGQ